MNQSDFYKKLLDSIKEMVKKDDKIILNASWSNDITKQLTESIQKNIDKLIPNHTGGLFSKELLDSLVNKLEKEKKEKKELFEMAFKKKTNSICKLFQKIDEYVLSNEIDSHTADINKLLDELSLKGAERDQLVNLIHEYKKQLNT